MSITTEIEVKNIIRLAALMELEEEERTKLEFIRDEMIQLKTSMSEDDQKKALNLYHKKIGLEPWM